MPSDESANYVSQPIEDYHEGRTQQMQFWQGANGQQGGDPAKFADALVTLSNMANPPERFLAGATAEQVISTLQEQIESHRQLSSSL